MQPLDEDEAAEDDDDPEPVAALVPLPPAPVPLLVSTSPEQLARVGATVATRRPRSMAPVRYAFTFLPEDEVGPGLADLRVPLAITCGRTPYFASFRSGWSLPVVAHEVGHILGLLDEYETFSGIVPCYPKTPFPGAEVSRMGLSMREGTRVLPLHHYLVLRRYFCPAPRRAFFDGVPP